MENVRNNELCNCIVLSRRDFEDACDMVCEGAFIPEFEDDGRITFVSASGVNSTAYDPYDMWNYLADYFDVFGITIDSHYFSMTDTVWLRYVD